MIYTLDVEWEVLGSAGTSAPVALDILRRQFAQARQILTETGFRDFSFTIYGQPWCAESLEDENWVVTVRVTATAPITLFAVTVLLDSEMGHAEFRDWFLPTGWRGGVLRAFMNGEALFMKDGTVPVAVSGVGLLGV